MALYPAAKNIKMLTVKRWLNCNVELINLLLVEKSTVTILYVSVDILKIDYWSYSMYHSNLNDECLILETLYYSIC